MKIAKLLLSLYFLNLFLTSCSSFSEAGKVMRNDKRTTDEFLIKKSKPLSQPPDFSVIPEPGSNKVKKDKKAIEEILNMSGEDNNKSSTKSSSTEQSIINQIKK